MSEETPVGATSDNPNPTSEQLEPTTNPETPATPDSAPVEQPVV